jgi:hypothetical protein
VSKKAEKEGEPRVEDEDADVDMADGGEAVAVTSTEANAKLDNETSSTPKAGMAMAFLCFAPVLIECQHSSHAFQTCT